MSTLKSDSNRKRRIGIDARIANYSASGISRYACGVLRGISEALCETPGADFDFLAITARRKRYFTGIPDPIAETRSFTPPHFPFERITLPLELQRLKLDLLHCTDFFTFPPKDVRALFSVHDVFFLKDPEILDRGSRRHYEQLVKLLPGVHHVTCISESTKSELSSMGFVPASRITVVYPGVQSPAEVTNAELKDIRKRFDLSERLVLFVGNIEPRKNIPFLARCFERARTRLPRDPSPQIVFAGRRGYRSDEIESECARTVPSANLRFLGEVSERTLSALYRSAGLLLFVTGGEGFGFPIVEAMSAGLPVITSNSSASAEIAGEAARLHHPEDETGVSESIVDLLTDPGSCDTYRTLGLMRAKEFTWRRTGGELLRLYSDLVK